MTFSSHRTFLWLLAVTLASAQEPSPEKEVRSKGPKPVTPATRKSGLEDLICQGTQEFTNTLSLLLTFGRESLEKPRKLDFGGNLGIILVENATLRGLETLSLREVPETYCDASVAEVTIPAKLGNVTVSIDWSTRPSLLLKRPVSGGRLTASLNDLDMNLGLTISREEPVRRILVSSLEIANLEGLEVQVETLTPLFRRPAIWRRSRGALPTEVAILRTVLHRGIQRFLDKGGLKF
ncbi:hypothetical protein HPB47_000798 [Ixodes persulcatus]|uniref:Uncharacterized protein n=1 Tax=Ixodes persulcatus TaxID=34615 RepID=A0AC60PQU8_IXOPE|nr:hypothetical protein HPB47_000798 [Ixodes persulcatus]